MLRFGRRLRLRLGLVLHYFLERCFDSVHFNVKTVQPISTACKHRRHSTFETPITGQMFAELVRKRILHDGCIIANVG